MLTLVVHSIFYYLVSLFYSSDKNTIQITMQLPKCNNISIILNHEQYYHIGIPTSSYRHQTCGSLLNFEIGDVNSPMASVIRSNSCIVCNIPTPLQKSTSISTLYTQQLQQQIEQNNIQCKLSFDQTTQAVTISCSIVLSLPQDVVRMSSSAELSLKLVHAER